MFPSSVQPPVLARIFPNEVFNCFCVFGGYPFQRVIFVGPFIWEDYAIGPDFKKETVADSPAITDDNGDILYDSD
jgi:hypothetical protein